MQKRTLIRSIAVAAALAALGGSALAQQWKPERPITIIVPWAAGGSTDQVTRVTAAEIEKTLGQKVVIVNQPGASGSIGSKSALDAPKDGYTWTAGAAQDLGYLPNARHAGRAKIEGTGTCSSASPTSQVVGVGASHAVQERQGAAGRHEGQARRDQGGHGRRHLGRPQRDGSSSRAPPASSTATSPTTAATPRWWPRSPARPTSPPSWRWSRPT
jgi:hypothetical protein